MSEERMERRPRPRGGRRPRRKVCSFCVDKVEYIDYKTEGWYVLVTMKAPAELPRERERNLQIYENVLRYLVVKLEEKRSNVKPRAARPAAPAVEAPAVEAAE